MVIQYHLERSTPESQGIASDAILQLVEALEKQPNELHSFMLLRHGSIVAEGWWSPYQRGYPHLLFSLSKSFTATAVGLAVNEGYFAIDDPVLAFFPDEQPAEVSDFLAALRVRHLLSMSTGHAVDTWASIKNQPNNDWIRTFFEVPIAYEPGTHFLYNTGATYLLSALVQKTTGMKVLDYLQPRLFEPLGIDNPTWAESPQGINLGGVGLSLKTEDIARFGQLYLQKGMWQGNRILPDAWVEAATAFQIANGDTASDSDWAQGYGYQFWRCRHDAYRGDGAFGQYCVVMPEQNAVLAITGGLDVFDMQEPLNRVWEILLPAMHAAPLPDDIPAQQKLSDKLSYLALSPQQGAFTMPIASQVSGQIYAVDANHLDIETIALNFNEADCRVSIKTTMGEETIPCGYGGWQHGYTSLFNGQWLSGATPVIASGAWTAETQFTMLIRLYETPFYYKVVFHFVGHEMLVEAQVNVSLESLAPLLLTAQRR